MGLDCSWSDFGGMGGGGLEKERRKKIWCVEMGIGGSSGRGVLYIGIGLDCEPDHDNQTKSGIVYVLQIAGRLGGKMEHIMW